MLCDRRHALLAPMALGDNISVGPYAEAAAITALLFPIVRPLYMSASPSLREKAYSAGSPTRMS